MSVICIGGLLVQWPSTPSQLSDGTSVVVVLTASGNDALRTKPLDRASATSWFMEGEHIQVPLRGEAFRLEIKYKNRGDAHESPLGYVELNSDELLARCLNGDTTAVFNVIGNQSPSAQMKLDLLLVPDEEVETSSESSTDAYDRGDLAAGLSAPYEVIDRLPDTDPQKWFLLMSTGAQHYERFRANPRDTLSLAKALSPFEEAIGILLDISPPKADQHQFVREKTETYMTAMSEFVSAFREFNSTAVDILSGMLRRSAAVFIMLYDRFGNRADLLKAIDICDQARTLVPSEHPDTPAHLRRRGMALTLRFRFSGNVEDINESIASLEESVRLTPESDIDLPDRLTNLGTSYVLRSEYARSLPDVNRAIAAHTRGLSFREDYILLMNLATAVLHRFMLQRDVTDAEGAVATLEKAVEHVPEGHPELRRCLGNLGVAYTNRFEAFHHLEDIDKAVSTLQDAMHALNDSGDDTPEEALHAASLGNAYLLRGVTLLDAQDLHLAIETLKSAISLTPPGLAHLQKPRSNLGNAYLRRHDLAHDPEDLEHAIIELEAALSLLPEGHADRPVSMSMLAEALQARFTQSSDIDDIDRAVRLNKDALAALGQQENYRRSSILMALASFYTSRFRASAELQDLDEAIRRHQDVMDYFHSSSDDPRRQCAATQLANALKQRHDVKDDPEDLDEAIANYRIAAMSAYGVPWTSFLAARDWARTARARGDSSAVVLQAYSAAVGLLPRVVWIGHAVADRHHQLIAIGGSMATEAVAAAIEEGEHCLAVQWLDQTRAILWGQQMSLRSSLDELRAVAPGLATELDRVSRALDTNGSRDVVQTTDYLGRTTLDEAVQDGGRRTAVQLESWRATLDHMKALTDVLDEIGGRIEVVQDTEAPAQEQRRLVEEWDRLVTQARDIPGLEYFMRPRSFSQIVQGLDYGPVVIVNADRRRCDALALMEGLEDVVHIPLESLTYELAQRLQRDLFRLLSSGNIRQRTTRAARLVSMDTSFDNIADILSELWKGVAKPILEALAFSATYRDEPQRIWWCPTGPLSSLPLHAAGEYTTSELGHKLHDYAVSSYLPTLAPRMPLSSDEQFHGILCVSQAATLPAADIESNLISNIAKDCHVDCYPLKDEIAVVETVLEGLEHYGWIHLACHGVQDAEEPTKSRFVLHDGPLALLEIIAASFKHADFAFLSACETAMGSDALPDEAAHLAAGMLAAGFRSVIGTMWSIQDADAPIVAEQVYRYLLSGPAKPDSSGAAIALHRAIKVLREQDEQSFSWVPFIHVGV